MSRYAPGVLLILAMALSVLGQSVQPATAHHTSVIGEIVAVDISAARISIKVDPSGTVATIIIDRQTTLLRVPLGERSLENAPIISMSDLSPGDRLYARYKAGADRSVAAARQVVVISGTQIKKKQSEEKEAWQKRGVSGVVVALNPRAREITIVSPQREGMKQIIVSASKAQRFRRYASDSIKFSDARLSSFEEVRSGDQLRALGDKNADGTRLAAEEIISGGFRTVGGTVTSLSPDSGEVRIKLFGSGQPVTLVAGTKSIIRRIPQKLAALIAQRAVSVDSKKTDAEDSQELVERLPTIPVSELKAGDVILTASTAGNDPTRLKAITVLAGIDEIINALRRLGALNNAQPVSTGLPPGILDVTAGQQ